MTSAEDTGPVAACILAGGVGTRLYPATRPDRPKQFQSFREGEPSLLTRTHRRAGFADARLVVTRESFAETAATHAPEATVEAEPEPLDTGPAMLYGTREVQRRFAAGTLTDRTTPDWDDSTEPVVLTLPSDHYIPDTEAFRQTMQQGVRVARTTGSLVAFGVEPTRAETGYGYVQPGADHGSHAEIATFHEKPAADTARAYVEAGYYWNSGIYAWTPSALFEACRATPLAETVRLLCADQPVAAYDAAASVSLDSGLMESAEDAAVVPASFEWDDLGAWDALQRLFPADDDGNTVTTETISIDAADNVVAGDHHVSLVGVEKLCVVAVDDRVLVLPVEQAQRVREVVQRLRDDDAF